MSPSNPQVPTAAGRCLPTTHKGWCNQTPNMFAQCITQETSYWQGLTNSPTFFSKKFPTRYRALKAMPYNQMPPDALRLNQTAGLPLASILTANRFNVVLSYLVPAGYDGVINVTLNDFAIQAGPAFQNASGQLTWCIGVNNFLAINYTNITTALGSTDQLGPVAEGGGIRIYSNDLIQYMVAASAGALAGGLDPAGIVVCAIQGWLYPNR